MEHVDSAGNLPLAEPFLLSSKLQLYQSFFLTLTCIITFDKTAIIGVSSSFNLIFA